MTYDAATRQLDLTDRPAFIISDPATMVHAAGVLHHRVSWNTLGTALNSVLAGATDQTVVNYLLRMSPGNGFDVIGGFGTALNRVRARQVLTAQQVAAIDTVEQLVFSLPCNLFLGLSTRADDPGSGIDFLPGDVNPDGTLPRANGMPTPIGQMQQQRERLAHRLGRMSAVGALADLDAITAAIVQLWGTLAPAVPAAAGVPALRSVARATGFAATDWAMAAGQFVTPAYRRWPGPLSAAQSAALNVTVMNRVNALG